MTAPKLSGIYVRDQGVLDDNITFHDIWGEIQTIPKYGNFSYDMEPITCSPLARTGLLVFNPYLEVCTIFFIKYSRKMLRTGHFRQK